MTDMLKKTENVAKNVANENSQDLTEQWKKGELPEGIYYCNTGNTVEILFTWGKNYHQLTNNKDEVYIPEMDDCEVLAPVPSYEEWKESYNCMLENEVLRLKNAQLKELLKEVKDYLPEFETPMDILAKIDEALQ